MTTFPGDPFQLLLTAGIASIRPLVAVTLMPLFSSSAVPVAARNAFVLAVVAPVVVAHADAAPALLQQGAGLMVLSLREAVIGVGIGLAFAAFFAGLQIVGDIIDHQTGLTFSQNVDPFSGNQVSVTAHLLERVLFTALIAGGALLAIVETIYLSFELWPIGRALPILESGVPVHLMASSGRLFALGLLLAAPVLFVLFVLEIAVGMMNRAAPQLNVFGLTLSIKGVVSLAVLVFALPLLVERTFAAFAELTGTIAALIRSGA